MSTKIEHLNFIKSCIDATNPTVSRETLSDMYDLINLFKRQEYLAIDFERDNPEFLYLLEKFFEAYGEELTESEGIRLTEFYDNKENLKYAINLIKTARSLDNINSTLIEDLNLDEEYIRKDRAIDYLKDKYESGTIAGLGDLMKVITDKEEDYYDNLSWEGFIKYLVYKRREFDLDTTNELLMRTIVKSTNMSERQIIKLVKNLFKSERTYNKS